MNTLEILFVALPIVALIAVVALFFSFAKDREYTITLNIEPEEEEQAPITSELIAKPKRRYKRRKKKVVTPVVEAPKAEIIPAVKKRVGRPKKTT